MADILTTDVLTEAQQRAVLALLNATTVRQAAREAGVPERTVYNWLKQPAFVDLYREARREATRHAVAKLQQNSGKAADRLVYLLTHGSPLVQLGAARSIIEFAIKSVELEDLDARLKLLEERYARQV